MIALLVSPVLAYRCPTQPVTLDLLPPLPSGGFRKVGLVTATALESSPSSSDATADCALQSENMMAAAMKILFMGLSKNVGKHQ
jgi:hypothetical protein